MKNLKIVNNLEKSVKYTVNETVETLLESRGVSTVSTPHNIVKFKVSVGFKSEVVYLKELNIIENEEIKIIVENRNEVAKIIPSIILIIMLITSKFNYFKNEILFNLSNTLFMVMILFIICSNIYKYLYNNFTIKTNHQ